MIATLGFPVELGLLTIARDSPRIYACRVILLLSLELTHSLLSLSETFKVLTNN